MSSRTTEPNATNTHRIKYERKEENSHARERTLTFRCRCAFCTRLTHPSTATTTARRDSGCTIDTLHIPNCDWIEFMCMQTKMDGSLMLTNERNSLNARVQRTARAYEPLKKQILPFSRRGWAKPTAIAKRKSVMDPSVHWVKLLNPFALSLSLCFPRSHAGDNFQSVNLNRIQKSRKHPLKKSIEFIPNQSNPKSNTSIHAFNFHSLYSAYDAVYSYAVFVCAICAASLAHECNANGCTHQADSEEFPVVIDSIFPSSSSQRLEKKIQFERT